MPKITSKKKTSKTKKAPAMPVVYGDRCFFIKNGPVLCSIKELKEALQTMTGEQYLFHAGGGKNDFASWVRGVFGDQALADDLFVARNKREAISVLTKFLKSFSL